jgi:hypothetical protein
MGRWGHTVCDYDIILVFIETDVGATIALCFHGSHFVRFNERGIHPLLGEFGPWFDGKGDLICIARGYD